MAIKIKLERNNLKPTILEFIIITESTELHMTIDSNNFDKNNKVSCSCLTTKGTQIYVEFTKTSGCDCIDPKKIQYKKKEEKCICFTPSMIKISTDKYVIGKRLTSQILLAIKSDNISIHWQKHIIYQPISIVSKDAYISTINMGSTEGCIIEKKFNYLTTFALIVDDNDGEINPYTISYIDSTLNHDIITLPHKYLCEKIENKSIKEILGVSHLPNLIIRDEQPKEVGYNSLEEKEQLAENIVKDLRSKIFQFVGDDEKKEGDVNNGK